MKTILIAEDRPEVRELVKVTLRNEQYTIIEAENAAQAVELAKTEKPSLILMDIMMPGKMDGLDAVKILKNDPATDAIKIIMLTAKGQQVDRDRGYAAGADDYFAKPFSPLELIQKVEEFLD